MPFSSVLCPTISWDNPATVTMAKQRNKSRTLKQQSSSRNPHTDTFPFTAPPPEIRLKIYLLLLLYCLNVGFWLRPHYRGVIYSYVSPRHPLSGVSGSPFPPELFCFNPKIWTYPERLEPPFSSQIFSINREICEDARVLLYGSKVFHFSLTRSFDGGRDDDRDNVHDQFNTFAFFPSRAACRLQHVQLLIQEDFNRASKFRDIRKSIECFVEALSHQHKLSSLNVELQCGAFRGVSPTEREANFDWVDTRARS
jgi:hypothetical protein